MRRRKRKVSIGWHGEGVACYHDAVECGSCDITACEYGTARRRCGMLSRCSEVWHVTSQRGVACDSMEKVR